MGKAILNYEFLILNFNTHRMARRTTMSRLAKFLFIIFTFALLYLYTFPTPAFADSLTVTPTLSVTPITMTPTITATPLPMRKYPLKVTVIPNPASGTKLSFRVMAPGPCKVRIRVNNRFFDVVAKLEKEGGTFFDILWSLKDVPEGIYYYQAQIEDKATGQITQLPLQKFVVLKSAD